MNRFFYILTCLLFWASCHSQIEEESKQYYADNGIYHWKTELSLSNWEKEFIKKHNIQKLYLRIFDVDYDFDMKMPLPIATTTFSHPVPQDIEVIPVIYITQEAINGWESSKYDAKFYKRILAMAKRNGFENFKEIQLDCDWNSSTEKGFFNLCQNLRALAKKDGKIISATIRLHQLNKKAPPVDRGVLMLYNTGSLNNAETENSILDDKDVKPYLKEDISYPLPLSFAYPTFGWAIQMSGSHFVAILRHTDFSDTNLYSKEDRNLYRVMKNHYLKDKLLSQGDLIRIETSDIDEIKKVQELVGKRIKRKYGNIIYHLDSLNLSGYTNDEINTILNN